MKFYDIISEYIKYDRMDINQEEGITGECIKEKKEFSKKIIINELFKIKDSQELKKVINDFHFILPPQEEFVVFSQYFTINKSSKEMIQKFIDLLYFWGPDYDDNISEIKKLVKENKLKEASDLCMNIKY